MHSAAPEFDAAGTWVASSYVRATARDFARFGLLYLRDGVWDGTRLLPEGWVDYGRTIESVDPEDGPYGAHWWGVAGDTLGHVPRLGLRGPVDHHLPDPRPRGGAPRQDAGRALPRPDPLAGRRGAGLRPGLTADSVGPKLHHGCNPYVY